jgi:hypothetical protein
MTYRFFYHYNKQAKCLTVHFKGACLPTDDLVCDVPTQSKHNKRQPRVVIQGWATGVTISEENGRRVARIR